MNAITLDTLDLSDDEMEALREQARAVIAGSRLSQSAAAKDAGVAYTTFAAWLNGSYAGNNQRVAADVKRWLAARSARQQTAAALPTRTGFIATPTADRIMPVLAYAQAAPDISVIVGAAGVGKTTALNQYRAQTPNVWLATMTPSTAGVSPMLRELCIEMGLEQKNAADLPRTIERKARGSGGLIVVDEAQHLSRPALEQLRSIHDRAAIGIVLAGNPAVLSRLEGDRKAEFAQLFSRIGMRLTLARPKAGDVSAILDAWGVTDAEETRLLSTIAGKPGALRGLDKCLVLATMVASGAGRARTADDIRSAWAQLDPQFLIGQSGVTGQSALSGQSE